MPGNEVIWFNSKIRIQNKSFPWLKAFKNGLIYVRQLFESGKFISFETASSKYLMSMMSYNSLKAAIPKSMKDHFKNNPEKAVVELSFYDMMKNSRDISRLVYKSHIKDVSLTQRIEKWQKELGSEVQYEDYIVYVCNIFKTTNIPKLRSFQYRLANRAIITNVHLSRWGKLDTDKCSFCGKQIENYTHLFVMCEKIRDIWIKIEEKMYEYNSQDIEFNVASVMWNRLVKNDPKNIKNFICLLFKQYVYRQRCLGETPDCNQFFNIISVNGSVERFIAKGNNKLDQHIKKWENASPTYYDIEISQVKN